MATAHVVITQSNGDTPAVGGLFEGISFFLVQRLPSRSSLIDKIQANGGRVVKIEKQADYVIADHFRKDCPPESVSYEFIDDAIKHGRLPTPNDHLAGPARGAVRTAASGVPGKSTRTPFTAEEDRELWRWVQESKRKGELEKGNEIYKQLEAKNSNHTWQSWRDRYIRKLMQHPPAGSEVQVPANPPPSPPTAQDEQDEILPDPVQQVKRSHSPRKRKRTQSGNHGADEEEAEQHNTQVAPLQSVKNAKAISAQQEDQDELENEELAFNEENFQSLFGMADDIEAIAEDQDEDAWEAWATNDLTHSAESWRKFYHEQVRPVYLERVAPKTVNRLRGGRVGSASPESNEIDVPAAQRNEEANLVELEAQVRTKDPEASDSQTRNGGTPPSETRKRRRVGSIEYHHGQEYAEGQDQTAAGGCGRFSTAIVEIPSEDEGADEERVDLDRLSPSLVQDKAAVLRNQHQTLLDRDGIAPTSELNQHAEEQLVNEATRPETDSERLFQTSDENRAADRQIRRESLDAMDEDTSPPRSPEHVSSEANHALRSQNSGLPTAEMPQEGHALTEANLASQQAQHRARLLRGYDLPEDNDELRDEFAKYLQDIANQTAQSKQPAALNVWHTANVESETRAIGELPMSSQQEIDNTFEDVLQWPQSPERRKERETEQTQNHTLQFETQVHYPQLSSQSPGKEAENDMNMFSSQAQGFPSYPQLPDYSSPMFQAPQEEPIDGEDGLFLAVPEPEGGWDHSSPAKPTEMVEDHAETDGAEQDFVELSSDSSSSSSSDDDKQNALPSAGPQAGMRRAVETQDILNAETQQPDFTFPLPPDSPPVSDNDNDSQILPSDPLNQFPSSPNFATAESQANVGRVQKLADDDLDTYIDTMVVHGYKEASIIEALKCTSMRPELAELVLLEEKTGKGLPQDIAGIWSIEEDKAVESGDAKALRKLEDKHTWEEVEARMQFLQDWRDEE